MQWAIYNNTRIQPVPGAQATCPACSSKVVPKCGRIVTWHWAHEIAECDPWYEPESQWHLRWKSLFPQEWQEVVVGAHRADVKTPSTIIELQSSLISPEEIAEREWFYGQMVWVLRGEDFAKNLLIRDRKTHKSFRWKWPRKSWWHAEFPIFIDLPDGLFAVKKLHHGVPCGGWGNWISHRTFMHLVGAWKPPHPPTPPKYRP